MRRRGSHALRWGIFAAVLCLGGSIALVVMLATNEDASVERGPAASNAPSPQATIIPEIPAKRLPVAGAEGFFVVVKSDGSSYLEGPDGKKTQLADAGRAAPDEAVVKKVAERVTHPPKKVAVGQLVICETGVVDVPHDAVLTFVGRDKVVTLNPDGSSTVYYTNGKVEKRDRLDRQSSGGKAGSP